MLKVFSIATLWKCFPFSATLECCTLQWQFWLTLATLKRVATPQFENRWAKQLSMLRFVTFLRIIWILSATWDPLPCCWKRVPRETRIPSWTLQIPTLLSRSRRRSSSSRCLHTRGRIRLSGGGGRPDTTVRKKLTCRKKRFLKITDFFPFHSSSNTASDKLIKFLYL